MKKTVKKYMKKRRWIALYKITKRRFQEIPGDNFPAFALR